MADSSISKPLQIALLSTFTALLVWCIASLSMSNNNRPALATVSALLLGASLLLVALPRLEEFTFGPKGVSGKLRKLQEDVDALKFLISGYVTSFELAHLRKLATEEPFYYTTGDTFLEELRRLWRHGLIKKTQPNWFFAHLPSQGDLRQCISVTKRGRQYLELLKAVQAEHGNDDESSDA